MPLCRGSVDAFGVTSFQGLETASDDVLCAGVNAGHAIVANVRNGAHWVLLTSCPGGGVYNVNDPDNFQSQYNYGDILEEAVYH